MYAHTIGGLLFCYAQALPFYGNDLASTGLCAAIIFGLYALAARLSPHTAASAQPAA